MTTTQKIKAIRLVLSVIFKIIGTKHPEIEKALNIISDHLINASNEIQNMKK